jgi:hypothetical protein
MSDTRPVHLPELRKKPANWRERASAARSSLYIASLKTSIFVSSHKSFRMTVLQVAGAAMALVGIALVFSAPVALIVGGIGAIVVAERQ